MKSERAVIKRWKMNIYGLGVIALVQSMAIPLINAFLKEFVPQEYVCNIALLVAIVSCIVVDIDFLLNRVVLLRVSLNKRPIKCSLEDIFLVGYKDNKQTRYAPFPIVRSLENHKLYLTYDKYSLLAFKATFNYSDRQNIRCTIYKSDGTPARLGDTVNMYLVRTIDIPCSIDHSKNIVKLKHRKIYFHHVNDQFDTDIFQNITFFKGAVDLDVDI